MKIHSMGLGAGLAAALAISGAPAVAADMAVKAPPPPPVLWSWTGGYIGGHLGGGAGRTHFSDPFGTSIYGDNVDTPFFLAGAQVGYNWQNGQWVFGVEGDASWMRSDGTNTCLAFSGFFVSSNCHADPNFLGTLTGRVGMALGPQGHTLVYVKGGAAFLHSRGDVTTNNEFFGFLPQTAASFSSNQVGGVVGVGVEQALSPAWSVNFEYNYMAFNGVSVPTGPSTFFPPLAIIAPNTTSATSSFQVAKVGVNYHFGADPRATWNYAVQPAYPVKAAAPPPVAWLPGWSFEAGSRVWFNTGKFQWDNSAFGPAFLGNPAVLESRLTYANLRGVAGELYSRVDSPWNIFLKGNVGVGTLPKGKQNDEDWGIFGAISYSNTLSGENNGKLGYGTFDAGYDFLRGANYKVGGFLGWFYLTQRSDTIGCVQIANPLFPCLAPGDDRLVGTQDTTWNAPRIGLNAETMLDDHWRLSGDVAYSPWTSFTGRDNHLLRPTTTFFDQSGSGGAGVQVEGIVSYFITPNFSVGAGGRYWALWTKNDSTFTCTGCAAPGVVSGPNFAKFSMERLGAFLQAEYKFDWTNSVVAKY